MEKKAGTETGMYNLIITSVMTMVVLPLSWFLLPLLL